MLKKDKHSGFTLIEILVALFICSIIAIFLIPNLSTIYKDNKKSEEKLLMKEILYEEILINKENISVNRGRYVIELEDKYAKISSLDSGEELVYEIK